MTLKKTVYTAVFFYAKICVRSVYEGGLYYEHIYRK